ncbi:MAG TPA: acyltransferase [Afipia sp.]|uniref:acyltransferase family protein n=1 Tax=unclassified Afipia TaxID=2642050 RepID=UPI000465D1E2|nr:MULTISPECIES: acyltransferase [unclassified Afipia]MAH67755.1 acyltransferase [Afipia sp.]OUX63128.1 MAG: acyltransferase [Afipia sp. TMED4]HAO40760.1 acyltransferase [Afipia sp.]HAP09673.1 acyltransferase [Afipia sp.]HBF56444.1 acyltransferase [Afipia sp.]
MVVAEIVPYRPYVLPKQIPALTGLRAVAALLVLGIHTDQTEPSQIKTFLPFLGQGHLGVDLFFILSGFIITHVYLANLREPSWRAVRIFLWHRLVRLYPVHVTVLFGLICMISIAKSAHLEFNGAGWEYVDLIWHLLLVQAWGVSNIPTWNVPSWSISVEWFMYLMFPPLAPLLARINNGNSALVLAAISLMAMTGAFVLFGWPLSSWVGVPALARVAGEFLCGATLCRGLSLDTRFGRGRWSGDAIGAGAFAAFLVCSSMALSEFLSVGLLAVAIAGVAESSGLLSRILSCALLVWLGEISYSVYMVHFPVLIVLRRLFEKIGYAGLPQIGRVDAFFVTALPIIAVSAVVFYVVERPVRTRLRDRMGILRAPSAVVS